jgi:Flp pilus assembly protein TadG
MAKGKTFLSKLIRRNSGVAAVEFAIVLPVLVLLIAGMMDLGHAFYLKQIITNASREGARYGILYKSQTGADGKVTRITPSNLSPSIQNWILMAPPNGQCDLNDLLAGDNPQVPLADLEKGTGYTSGTTGDDLVVTVTCDKTWWILDKFIPGLTKSLTLSATTTMRVE